jgi:hypothetical protein
VPDVTDAGEDTAAASPVTHRPDYPNVAGWLADADSDHWWVRLLDTERHPDVRRPTLADMVLRPLDILITAVGTANPRGLGQFIRNRFRDHDPANLLSARLELLSAANLAIQQIPFEFGGTGEPDLTLHPGTDAQGWIEIHRGAFSVFDVLQQDIETELASKNATLTVRLVEWPLEVDNRNSVHTRVSQAIDTAVKSGAERVVAIPELGLGAIGTVRRQGQEFLGLSRITVQHAGLTPSATYLRSLARRLARKVNVEKAGQGRKGSWNPRTILLIDISTAHLTLLLGHDDLAAWLDDVDIEWQELPFAGVAVCFSDLHSRTLGGVCRYRPGLADAEHEHLEPTLTALNLPATQAHQ